MGLGAWGLGLGAWDGGSVTLSEGDSETRSQAPRPKPHAFKPQASKPLSLLVHSAFVNEAARFKVLVVEDETDLLKLIAESLEADGFAVAQSTDAADAIERLRSFAYDGVVTDLRLPDADGMTVLDEALTRYPESPPS